jgi:hypothetical protein
LVEGGDREGDLERLGVRLELLLKHDWERAKLEAGWVPHWLRGVGRAFVRPRLRPRPTYSAVREWRLRRPINVDELPPPS